MGSEEAIDSVRRRVETLTTKFPAVRLETGAGFRMRLTATGSRYGPRVVPKAAFPRAT